MPSEDPAGQSGPGTSTRNAETRATVASVGEHGLIQRIRSRLSPAPDWLIVDAGDDAAVYEPQRNALEVITTDAIVEGVHFDRTFTPAAAIGHRALAVNLSDLAAMGAEPRLATLSMALPPELPLSEFDGIVTGLLALAERTRTRLVGGNITATSGPLVIDVTAVGSVARRRVLTRAGARPGDHVFVSGTLGDARAGLAQLRSMPADEGSRSSELVARYLQPEPRLRLGQQLGRRQAATATIDLSDGLADGLARLAEASGVGFAIQAVDVPVHEDARAHFRAANRDPVREAISGGDDYELLFTVHPRHLRRLKAVERLIAGLRLTRIGVVTRTPGLDIIHPDGQREPVSGGYEHFKE
jgi:thiamine-monophosphate kinase